MKWKLSTKCTKWTQLLADCQSHDVTDLWLRQESLSAETKTNPDLVISRGGDAGRVWTLKKNTMWSPSEAKSNSRRHNKRINQIKLNVFNNRGKTSCGRIIFSSLSPVISWSRGRCITSLWSAARQSQGVSKDLKQKMLRQSERLWANRGEPVVEEVYSNRQSSCSSLKVSLVFI